MGPILLTQISVRACVCVCMPESVAFYTRRSTFKLDRVNETALPSNRSAGSRACSTLNIVRGGEADIRPRAGEAHVGTGRIGTGRASDCVSALEIAECVDVGGTAVKASGRPGIALVVWRNVHGLAMTAP